MRQISRNLVVFMSASPCTSNYETGSYVVRVKVMNHIAFWIPEELDMCQPKQDEDQDSEANQGQE